jgi:hypothetical protein
MYSIEYLLEARETHQAELLAREIKQSVHD